VIQKNSVARQNNSGMNVLLLLLVSCSKARSRF
jgi:hypothetical protein